MIDLFTGQQFARASSGDGRQTTIALVPRSAGLGDIVVLFRIHKHLHTMLLRSMQGPRSAKSVETDYYTMVGEGVWPCVELEQYSTDESFVIY